MLQDFDIKIPMNNEEYKNKLSAVCDWQYDEVILPGPKVEDEIDRWDYDEENPVKVGARGISIIHVKPQIKQCEGCGLMVTSRSTNIKKSTSVAPHWREKCNVCNMYKNPWTGAFDVPKHIAHELYNFFWANNNRNEPGPSRFSKYYNK